MVEIPAPAGTVGVAMALGPLLRRILGPGVGEGAGVNTYLVGIDEIVVVDPGPDEPSHVAAVEACGGGEIRWIVLSCDDPCYAGAAAALRERTGAVVLGPKGIEGVTAHLGARDVIEGTEFRLRCVPLPTSGGEVLGSFVEQEGVLLTGPAVLAGPGPSVIADQATLTALAGVVSPLRVRRLAPGRGEVIADLATLTP